MRALLLAAFLSSTALVASAGAQTQPTVTPNVIPQGEAQGRASVSECERLADFISESKQSNAGVTADQALAWKQAGNGQACHDTLERIKQAAAAGSSGAGIKPVPASPPQASASGTAGQPVAAAAAPATETTAQVVVQQVQPSVTVRQLQPEVIVRMPPPVITVQQPQPEVIVRMPPPDVNVSVAKPEIQVTMPQPQVQVVPPQQAQAQPNVQVDGQQPNVRIERTGEPKLIYQQAEGQPQVRFEAMNGQGQTDAAVRTQSGGTANATTAPQSVQAAPQALTPQAAQAQLNGGPSPAQPGTEPQLTGALPSVTQTIDVAKLEDMALYNGAGEKMGDIDEVVIGPGNTFYLVVAHGGFLGLGEKKVAMPIDQVAMRGDRLVAEGLTDEQIKALPAYKDNDTKFKETEEGQTAPVRVLQ